MVTQRAVPDDKELRKLLGAIIVIAANAGKRYVTGFVLYSRVCASPRCTYPYIPALIQLPP